MLDKRMTRAAFLTGTAAMALSRFGARDAFAAGSWDPFLALMMADANLKAGALFGGDGVLWAKSPTFPALTSSEAQAAVAGVTDHRKFQAAGIVVGMKYMFLAALASGAVLGRKGAGSILLQKTNKALVIGLTKDGVNAANVTGVGVLADRLKKMNF